VGLNPGLIKGENVSDVVSDLTKLAENKPRDPFSMDSPIGNLGLKGIEPKTTIGSFQSASNLDHFNNILFALHPADLNLLIKNIPEGDIGKIFGVLEESQLKLLRVSVSAGENLSKFNKAFPAPLTADVQNGLVRQLNAAEGDLVGLFKGADKTDFSRVIPVVKRENLNRLFQSLDAKQQEELIQYMSRDQAAQVIRDNMDFLKNATSKEESQVRAALFDRIGMDASEARAIGGEGGGAVVGFFPYLEGVFKKGAVESGSIHLSPNTVLRLRNTSP
jgi:hypothetical protein